MMKLTIITLILAECGAQININIRTSNNIIKNTVKYKGSDIKLITDEEIALFNVTRYNLNQGVRVEMGKYADDIFLRDPTPYEDLFKEYEWPEVARTLTIRSAKIIEFMQENVLIKTHEHVNNTTVTIESKTDMMEMRENTAASLWSAEGLPTDLIICNVNIDFGFANWSYDAKWRDEGLKSKQVPVGASKGVIPLKSGQTIESKLLGIKIVMLIEIEYLAKLVGNIITDYENLFGKYHFYSPTIGNIMRAAKLKNEIITKEYLELRFYTNPRIEVFDKDTGEELAVLKPNVRSKVNYTYRKPKPKRPTKSPVELKSVK